MGEGGYMGTFVFVMPVLPGKEEADRTTLEGLSVPGPARDSYLAARRAAGLTREAVWHQKTPMGTFAVVLLEANDIEGAFGHMVTSDDPFDQTFREFVRDVHGVDLEKDPPPDVALISDVHF
jgi:hypothetical protein